MTIYRGLSGVNRQVKDIYRGLGGVNRAIKEQYRGAGGVNKRVFDTRIDVNDGSFLNHTKTLLPATDTVDGSQGFKIVGRGSKVYANMTYADLLRWDLIRSLTGYSRLSLYARKQAIHGMLIVCIDCPDLTPASNIENLDTYRKLWIGHSALPTSWTKYTIDVSGLSGAHKIGIIGGYIDWSGNLTSETQICKIELL